MRVFIGLDIPMKSIPHYRILEKSLQDFFKSNNTEAYFKEEGQFHLTLQFLGEMSEVQVQKINFLEIVAKNFGKPDLFVDGMGAIPSMDKANKVCLGVRKDPRLDKLFIDVKENLKIRELSLDKRPFRPHITIANLGTTSNVYAGIASVQQMFSILDFQPKNINLYQSHPGSKGSTYQVLQSVELAEPMVSKFK